VLTAVCYTPADLPGWLVGDELVQCEGYLRPDAQEFAPCIVAARRGDGEVRTFVVETASPYAFCEALEWAAGVG